MSLSSLCLFHFPLFLPQTSFLFTFFSLHTPFIPEYVKSPTVQIETDFENLEERITLEFINLKGLWGPHGKLLDLLKESPCLLFLMLRKQHKLLCVRKKREEMNTNSGLNKNEYSPYQYLLT